MCQNLLSGVSGLAWAHLEWNPQQNNLMGICFYVLSWYLEYTFKYDFSLYGLMLNYLYCQVKIVFFILVFAKHSSLRVSQNP